MEWKHVTRVDVDPYIEQILVIVAVNEKRSLMAEEKKGSTGRAIRSG